MFNSLRKQVKDAKRLEEIFKVLAKHEINLLKQKKKISPQALKSVLEELGATFIKLGQLLSLRPDLIPNEYCMELAKLQDSVKPVPTKNLQDILDKNFHKFKISLSKKPLGSASIAQAHTANYKNKKIVVKIVKPGIKEKFESDLDILAKITKLLEKKISKKHFDVKQIFEEFETYTRNELNLSHELANLERVREFKHQKGILIPKPINELSNEIILAMEYLPGKKLSSVKNPPKNFVSLLAKEFWDEIFEHGVFHADPHPGNILIGKQLGLIDWGIIGELSHDMKQNLKAIFFGTILRDNEVIYRAVQKLNVAQKPLNSYEFKRDLQSSLDKFYGKDLNDLKVGEIFQSLIDLMRKYDFYIDKNYILLMKCIVTIEGTGLSYEKNFNLFETALPYVKSKTKKSLHEHAFKEMKDLMKSLSYLKQVPQELNSFFEEELRQERLLLGIKDEITSLDRDLKHVAHELLIGFGVAIIFLVSVISLNIKTGNLPIISIVGFFLTFALLMNLLYYLRK